MKCFLIDFRNGGLYQLFLIVELLNFQLSLFLEICLLRLQGYSLFHQLL